MHLRGWVWFVVLVALGAAVGCGGQREPWPANAAESERDPAAVTVTVAPVDVRPVQRTVETVGTLYGAEEVSIAAKVEGRIRKICHDVADRVKPGDILLEIDTTDYELLLQQSRKALTVELARFGLDSVPKRDFDVTRLPPVMQAKAKQENCKRRLDRARQTGVATAEELTDKATDARVAQAEYENQVLEARARLATIHLKNDALTIAEQQLKDTQVRVPVPSQSIHGSASDVVYAVTQRSVSEGSYVKSGTEVFKLVIETPLKLRVPVPERHAPEIRVEQKVEVFTDAYPRPFQGTVSRINPAVDPVTRTFQVEIIVPNVKGELKPGCFAKAVIATRLDSEAATVPLEAPVSFAGVTKVFLLENGRAKEVQVALGVQSTSWVEVVQPKLPPGARVVTSGQSTLADGTPVTIRGTKVAPQ
jgi:RND family efflux transporter MFP subunit